VSNIQYDLDNLKSVPLPLYHCRPGLEKPQPACVEMDNFGTVTAKWVEDNPPMLHLGAFLWEVSPCADGESLAVLLESPRMQSLFHQVHEGARIAFSDNRHFVTLDPISITAESEIRSMLENESPFYSRWEVWNAKEWFKPFFSAEEVASKDSLTDYLVDVVDKKMLEAEKNHRVAIYGTADDLVLDLCADHIKNVIQNGEKADEQTEKLAYMLARHDPNRYSDILYDCRALEASDTGSMPFNQDNCFCDEFAEYRSASSDDVQEGV